MKILGKVIIVVAICAAVANVSAWWITRPGPKAWWPEENVTGRSIEMVAEEAILHYQENLFWSENQFSGIMENQNEFTSTQISQFESMYGKQAVNAKVGFVEAENLTILTCDVHEARMDSTFDFHWFLNALKLDFIDRHFQKSEKELSWQGSIGCGLKTYRARW